MLLDIKADSDIIENWLKLVNNNDVETKIIAEAQKGETTENKAVFGLDIREIPEHTDIINLWVNETRKQLEKLGISFEEITFGDGWECPYNNPHYKKLRKAYEKVMGEPSPRLGKPHGNDGRFFNGNAVVFGQTGQNPHGPNEAHYLGSIAPYLQILDELAKQYI